MAERIKAPSTTNSPGVTGPMGFGTVALVFGEWCLRRETPNWPPRMMRIAMLLPAALAWWLSAVVWPDMRHPSAGAEAVRHLATISGFAVLIGGVQFASRAVCWEVSAEMRDIVRLTGLDARLLLWLKSFACWWTIGWSVVLLLPLLLFAITMGGVNSQQLLAGVCGLLMLSAIVGAFAMLAGVLAIDSKNPEKTAATATWLGLVFYNVSFALASQMVFWGERLWRGHVSPTTEAFCRRLDVCSPLVSVRHALTQSTLFEPTDPGYWLHFLTAAGCVALASLIIEVRFRSSVSDGVATSSSERAALQVPLNPNVRSDSTPQSGSVDPIAVRSENSERITAEAELAQVAINTMTALTAGNRRRCSNHPFFWKDVYVLSDERKWVNTWTMFYLLATIIILFVSVTAWDMSNRYWIAFAAFLSIVVTTIILSMRFDALLAAEFRDRTWGSLMLLPVDPEDLLWTKLAAAMYEQRFAFLPTGLAICTLMIRGPGVAAGAACMAVVVASFIGALLCQLSCINQLLGKVWWLGPVQIIGFIAAIVPAILLWIKLGLFPGFIATSVLLSVIIVVIYACCVLPLVRNWIEAT